MLKTGVHFELRAGSAVKTISGQIQISNACFNRVKIAHLKK